MQISVKVTLGGRAQKLMNADAKILPAMFEATEKSCKATLRILQSKVVPGWLLDTGLLKATLTYKRAGVRGKVYVREASYFRNRGKSKPSTTQIARWWEYGHYNIFLRRRARKQFIRPTVSDARPVVCGIYRRALGGVFGA